MLNRVVLVGRMTRDADLRYTASGTAVANFTVAANRPFKNDKGEQEADFINCVVWRKPAENLTTYMRKGSLIGVDGRIQTRHYEGDDGKRVYVTEVVAENIQYLEPKKDGGGQGQGVPNNQGQQNNPYQNQPQANPYQNQQQGSQNQGFNNQQQTQNQNQGFNNQQQNQQANQNQGQNNSFQGQGDPIDIAEDDLPF